MDLLKKNGLFFFSCFLFFYVPSVLSISNKEVLTKFHDGNSFVISCPHDSFKCSFYAKNYRGLSHKEKIVLSLNRTRIIWHGKSLLELRVHLGTNDDTSLFFDFNKMLFSKKGFENVIVVDDNNLIVIYPDHEELLISALYRDAEPVHIKRDFYSSPEMSIDEKKTHFLPNGSLFLRYSIKANNKDGYSDKEEVVNISWH